MLLRWIDNFHGVDDIICILNVQIIVNCIQKIMHFKKIR